MSETTGAPAAGAGTGGAANAGGVGGGVLTGAGAEAPPAADARAWLPEEYRQDPTFADLKDVAGLAKSYKHAATLVGADRAQVLRLPKDPAAPEWGDVWTRLGRPEKADGYGLKAPGGLPADTLTAISGVFHEAGLSKAQAERIMGWYGDTVTTMQQQQLQAAEAGAAEAVRTLKQEWGQAYDDHVHAARRAVREIGGPDFIKLLDETGLHSHPAMVRLMAKIGMERMEPGGLKGGSDGQFSGGRMTPAAARAELSRLKGDREFAGPLMDRNHPGHKAARERWDLLNSMAYAADSAA